MEAVSLAVSNIAVETSAEQGVIALPEAFSFVWLETLIGQYMPMDDAPTTSKLERCLVVAGVVFGALVPLVSFLFAKQLGVRLLEIILALQCLCAMACIAHAGWQAWCAYQRQHQTFACDLDHQLLHYNVVVDTVRQYPLAVINMYLRYVRDRKSRLTYRGGLISGGFDKIGMLPLLLAIYLQCKDWTFGGWKALAGQVHPLGLFLVAVSLGVYLVSWWAARAKGRLDLYEMLLAEASVRAEAAK